MTGSIFDYLIFGANGRVRFPDQSKPRIHYNGLSKYYETVRRTEENKKQRERTHNKKANQSRKKNRRK